MFVILVVCIIPTHFRALTIYYVSLVCMLIVHVNVFFPIDMFLKAK